MYNREVSTWSASEARAALPEILDRVEAGEEAVITRHGKPVAVVIRPDALRVRRAATAFAAAEELRGRLERARRAHEPGPGIDRRRAQMLIRELRAERDRG
jgi:antitoxin (DNA-binding transcriptional repressor) of toxin-antitoxin stability system